jgi:predicted DNA-binding transcriptional regulator AlpA
MPKPIKMKHDGGHAPPIEPLLTEDDLAAVTGEAVKTLRKRRLQGTGCPFIRIGRLVRYRPADVRQWLASMRPLRSTSEPAAA